MVDRRINFGDPADSGTRWQIEDDANAAGGGNFVLAKDLDGGTVLLQYNPTSDAFEYVRAVDMGGEDVTGVGGVVGESGAGVYDDSSQTVGDGTTSADHESVSTEQASVSDTSTDPSTAGEFRQNEGDVKVYSGGGVKNLTNIGSGGGETSAAYDELAHINSNLYDHLGTGWVEASENPLITNGTGLGATWPSVINIEGAYYLYWDDHDSEILYATASSVLGSYSTQGTAVAETGTGWNAKDIGAADVFPSPWDSSYDYHMLYHGEPSDSKFPQETGLARSNDGVNWDNWSAVNPVITAKAGTWRPDHLGYARHIRVGNMSFAFHRGDRDAHYLGFSYGETPDKLSPGHALNPLFNANESVPSWRTGAMLGQDVVRIGGTFVMLMAADDSNSKHRIGIFTSPDGINWTPHPMNPIPALDTVDSGGYNDYGLSSPDLYYEDGTLYLFCDADDGSSSGLSIACYTLDVGELEVIA